MSSLLIAITKNQNFRSDVDKYISELERGIQGCSFFKTAETKVLLPAKESSTFFSECIQALEEQFISNLNSYSPMRWMYYLRRIPNAVFGGKLSSTAPNSRALAEIYANSSSKSESATFGFNGFEFPVNDATLRHIARFIAFIVIIYDLQVGFRFANKGCEYEFKVKKAGAARLSSLSRGMDSELRDAGATSLLPKRVANSSLESAVSIYDKRHDYKARTFLGTFLNRAGLAYEGAKVETEVDIRQAFWGLQEERRFSPQTFLEGHPYAEKYGKHGQVLRRFGAADLQLSQIFDLYRLPVMAKEDIHPNAALCLLTLLLGGGWLHKKRYACLKTMEVGYYISDYDDWIESGEKEYLMICEEISKHLPHFCPPENFTAFSESCMRFKGEAWPLAHGAPVKITPNYVCVDMWAASMGFLHWFQFPNTQGKIANERAVKFEDLVQEVLDRSSWAHAASRTLRQRTLRIDDKALTDIDAIGSRDGVLLIISCKSIPYTREYDQGVHVAIRNAASTVNKAVSHWTSITSCLKHRQQGDNFNLSDYKEIVGLVCTPFAVYTSDAQALSVVFQDLRMAASLDELAAFLSRDI